LPVNPSAPSRPGAGAGTAPSAAAPALCIGTRQIHGPGGQTLAASSHGDAAALSELVRALPGWPRGACSL